MTDIAVLANNGTDVKEKEQLDKDLDLAREQRNSG